MTATRMRRWAQRKRKPRSVPFRSRMPLTCGMMEGGWTPATGGHATAGEVLAPMPSILAWRICRLVFKWTSKYNSWNSGLVRNNSKSTS